jgi:hypothetical protein
MQIHIIVNGAVINYLTQRRTAKEAFEVCCWRNILANNPPKPRTDLYLGVRASFEGLDQTYRKWINPDTGDVIEMKRIS